MASERAERKNILLRTSQRGGSCVCHPGHKAQLWFRRSRAPCSIEPTPDAPASGPSTVLSYSLAFGLSMGAVPPHTLLAQLSPQCFPTAQGSSNVCVQLIPSPQSLVPLVWVCYHSKGGRRASRCIKHIRLQLPGGLPVWSSGGQNLSVMTSKSSFCGDL